MNRSPVSLRDKGRRESLSFLWKLFFFHLARKKKVAEVGGSFFISFHFVFKLKHGVSGWKVKGLCVSMDHFDPCMRAHSCASYFHPSCPI